MFAIGKFSLFIRSDASHKRESKCAEVFFHPTTKRTHIQTFVNEYMFTIWKRPTLMVVDDGDGDDDDDATPKNNNKRQVASFECLTVVQWCLCLADYNEMRSKAQAKRGHHSYDEHVYAKYVWQWQPNKRHCFLFMCSRSCLQECSC